MVDDGVALLAEPVDQRADSRLVLRVGSFELVDLRVDQRLQLDGARQRALDAFAHRRDFAADGLADHHDAIVPVPSGSANRNATSVIDCAAIRMSCARRTMTPNAQNRISGTMTPTARRISDGLVEQLLEGGDVPEVGPDETRQAQRRRSAQATDSSSTTQ